MLLHASHNDLLHALPMHSSFCSPLRACCPPLHAPTAQSFYDSWLDQKNLTVNFITELFTSGTLRQ